MDDSGLHPRTIDGFSEENRRFTNEMKFDVGDTSTDTSSSSEDGDEEAFAEWIKRSKAKLEPALSKGVSRFAIAPEPGAGMPTPIKFGNLIITKVVKMEPAGSKKIFRCNYDRCQKMFSSTSGLKLHLVAHSDMNRPFVCETCGLRQYTAENMKAHVSREHKSTKAQVKSRVAPKPGSNPSN